MLHLALCAYCWRKFDTPELYKVNPVSPQPPHTFVVISSITLFICSCYSLPPPSLPSSLPPFLPPPSPPSLPHTTGLLHVLSICVFPDGRSDWLLLDSEAALFACKFKFPSFIQFPNPIIFLSGLSDTRGQRPLELLQLPAS